MAGHGSDGAVKTHKSRKGIVIGVVIVVVVIVGVGAWLLWHNASTGNNRPQTFTQTVAATQGTQTQTVSLSGTLAPQDQANLSFSVSGTVTHVYVKVGDTVTMGQKLADVDPSSLQNAVDLAQANLTSAQASYNDAVSANSSSSSLTAAKAQVTSAQASLTSAKDSLANAVLKSTINGTVASVGLSVGDTIGSGSSGNGGSSLGGSSYANAYANAATSATSSSSITVISTSKWLVNATVGSADLGSLKAGQKAQITPDGATKPIVGTVASVGIVATSTSSSGSSTFPVVINLTGIQQDLYSGTNATAVVTVATYDNVLTVPTAAVTTANGQAQVTVSKNGQTSTQQVTTGRVFGNETEITKGLNPGDQVVITVTMFRGGLAGGLPSGAATGRAGMFGGGMGGNGGGGIQINPGGGGGYGGGGYGGNGGGGQYVGGGGAIGLGNTSLAGTMR